jgi:hypothetical protein
MSMHGMHRWDTTSLPPPNGADNGWTYDEAFARHRGLLARAEQARIRQCRVAIAGMGGVGGIHLITLARLGIGAFTVADPDRFEVANFNRQYGANLRTLGQNKAVVMAEGVRSINPEVNVQVFAEAITPANVDSFLDGADIYVDGIDFFALETRRLLFREARRRGIWAVTAGPIGFSTAWLSFSPTGMSFEEYFDFDRCKDRLDRLISFVVGLAPAATHRGYMDLSQVDTQSGRGPSAALACQLCSGVATADILKILLGRGPVRPAPWYHQFDAYRMKLSGGYLRWGNRHPWQRVKRWLARKQLVELGWQERVEKAD